MNSHANNISGQQNTVEFEQLFQFIQKNKVIRASLASLTSENVEIDKLLEAILIGDSQAEIFSHPDCYLYLLYLMQNQRISLDQGVSVYLYLLCLMQFTNKQPLKTDDHELNFLADLKEEPLVDSLLRMHEAGLHPI